MADSQKPAPAPPPPDKVQPLPADAFFSEKRGNGTAPAKKGSDPTRPAGDADAVISDAPGSHPDKPSDMAGTSALPAERAPAIRQQEQGRDLTPQEWEDFIRQHGPAMLPPDGEG
jgi:hypothetical protein